MVPTPEAALPDDGRAGAALPLPAARSSAATDVALVATFAAFIAVCALLPAITLPGMAVPITLQTFGVMLAALVLGPVRGALAVLLYLAVGFAGIPVFSEGTGGLATFGKVSLGYLLAFPVAALVAGLLSARALHLRPGLRPLAFFASATAASLLVVHPLGITVMGARLGLSGGEAIAAGATFLPGDVVKNVLAAVVATAVLRAFPDLRARRR